MCNKVKRIHQTTNMGIFLILSMIIGYILLHFIPHTRYFNYESMDFLQDEMVIGDDNLKINVVRTVTPQLRHVYYDDILYCDGVQSSTGSFGYYGNNTTDTIVDVNARERQEYYFVYGGRLPQEERTCYIASNICVDLYTVKICQTIQTSNTIDFVEQ